MSPFWWRLLRYLLNDRSAETSSTREDKADNRFRLVRSDLEGLDNDRLFEVVKDEVFNRHVDKDRPDRYEEPLRHLILLYSLYDQLMAGGWEHFLFSRYAGYFDHTYRALQAAGLGEWTAIMDDIRQAFPRGKVPADLRERRHELERVIPLRHDDWDERLRRWNEWSEARESYFRQKVVEYARRHLIG